MADKEKRERGPNHFYIKNVRVRFSDFNRARASVKDGPPKFNGTFLIDPDTKEGKIAIKELNRAVKAVYDEVWKGKPPRFKEGRKCYIPGEDYISETTGEPYDGTEGMIILKASASEDDRPNYFTKGRKTIPDDKIRSELYNGCWVEVQGRFYAITDKDKGGNGLFCYLLAVRKWADDEAFAGGGGGVGADDFDQYDGEDDEDFDHDDDDDPTAGIM